jgi:prepilin-type N-terminal cleavage/methylation domain-containing protein
MKNRLGFTLLEVVIVIGILSLFVGAGIVALVPFRERREVLGDARNMASLLKQVQVKASAVEIPSDCEISGVSEFELQFSGADVDLLVKTSSGATCKQTLGVLNLSNGTEFVFAGQVVFITPFGSTDSSTISVCNYGIQYDLEINENGSISEPVKSATPGC